MDQVFWIVRPSEETFVTKPKVHLAYRTADSHLLRGSLSADTRGGIMAIDSLDCVEPTPLAAEILSECTRFGYHAVLFALPEQFSAELVPALEKLETLLTDRGLTVILPITYAEFCPHALYRISSAISGGSLRSHLEELIDTYGAKKLVLEHPLTRMEFCMPSLTREGTALTQEAFSAVLEDTQAQPFYSSELCLNYCTYQRCGEARFLLFDDARSIAAKLQLGSILGIKKQLLLYYELKDFYLSL